MIQWTCTNTNPFEGNKKEVVIRVTEPSSPLTATNNDLLKEKKKDNGILYFNVLSKTDVEVKQELQYQEREDFKNFISKGGTPQKKWRENSNPKRY